MKNKSVKKNKPIKKRLVVSNEIRKLKTVLIQEISRISRSQILLEGQAYATQREIQDLKCQLHNGPKPYNFTDQLAIAAPLPEFENSSDDK
jgi:hypothetical protein